MDPVDVGARSHHLADRPVGEPDDARDDRPLALLDHSGMMGLGDDQVELLGGHLRRWSRRMRSSRKISALVLSSSQTSGAVARASHSIGSAIVAAIGSGERKRELLGHQLADHQRGIGGEDDDQREAEGLRGVGRDAEQGQPLARPARRGSRPNRRRR